MKEGGAVRGALVLGETEGPPTVEPGSPVLGPAPVQGSDIGGPPIAKEPPLLPAKRPPGFDRSPMLKPAFRAPDETRAADDGARKRNDHWGRTARILAPTVHGPGRRDRSFRTRAELRRQTSGTSL
jgi:hypothetical protein